MSRQHDKMRLIEVRIKAGLKRWPRAHLAALKLTRKYIDRFCLLEGVRFEKDVARDTWDIVFEGLLMSKAHIDMMRRALNSFIIRDYVLIEVEELDYEGYVQVMSRRNRG